MSARAWWWKSTLSISDTLSSSILLGSGTFSSLLRIRRLFAKLEPFVTAAAELPDSIWFGSGIVSHHPVCVGSVDKTIISIDVVLGVSVFAAFSSGFDICLCCLPGCSCWHSSGFSNTAVCITSLYTEAYRLAPSVSTFHSSLCPLSIAVITLVTMSLMSLPHSTSSWWYMSQISSLSPSYIFYTQHCASNSAVCPLHMFAIFAMVCCSFASLQDCCWATPSIQLFQFPEAKTVAGVLHHLLCIPFLCLYIHPSGAVPAVSMIMGITTIAILNTWFIGVALLPTPSLPVLWLVISLPLTSAIHAVWQTALPV